MVGWLLRPTQLLTAMDNAFFPANGARSGHCTGREREGAR